MTDEEKEEVCSAFDSLLANWGKKCRLIFPGKKVNCPSCFPPGKTTGSAYYPHKGGPVPFQTAAHAGCPVCSGTGKKEQEVSEEKTFLVTFEPKEFLRPAQPLDIRVPYSLAQIKGSVSDWVDLKRCDRIVIQHPVESYTQLVYKLAGEPLDIYNVSPGRYFAALLERTS